MTVLGWGEGEWGEFPWGDPFADATDPGVSWRTLKAAERELYFEALKASHGFALRVQLHNRDEVIVGSATFPRSDVSRGEVQVDSTQPINRQMTLELIDPTGSLSFPTSPDEAALSTVLFVSVDYLVWVDPLLAWVSAAVVWGRITKVDRQGAQVFLEAQDKAALMQQPASLDATVRYPAGTRITSAITDLASRFGETRFSIPDLPDTLHSDLAVSLDDDAWDSAFGLAASLNRQLFYSSDGRLTLRRVPAEGQALWQFDVTAPRYSWDMTQLRNVIRVTGGADSDLVGVARAAPSHPFSPESLAHNGQPFVLLQEEQDDSLTTQSQVNARAADLLGQLLNVTAQAQFLSYPVPILQPLDRVVVADGPWRSEFNLAQFTLPLTGDGEMSVGTLAPVVDLPRTNPRQLAGRVQ